MYFLSMVVQSLYHQCTERKDSMHLEKGLEVLVKDWRNLHEEGGAKMSVEEIVGRLGDCCKNKLIQEMNAEQIAELIIADLRQIPGALENAEKFIELFASPEDLLEEIDLDCLVSDLLMTEDDDV